jgi:hypothetical protein
MVQVCIVIWSKSGSSKNLQDWHEKFSSENCCLLHFTCEEYLNDPPDVQRKIANFVSAKRRQNSNHIKVWGDRFWITLYDIIFWWWLNTCNSDQNLCWTLSFFKLLNLPPKTFMSWNKWSCRCPLCQVCHQVLPKGAPGMLPSLLGASPFHSDYLQLLSLK